MTRNKSLEATRPKGKNTPKCMSEGVPKTKSRMKKGNNDLKKGKGNSMTTRVVKTETPCRKETRKETNKPSINTTLKKRTSEPMTTISSDPDNAVTTGGKKIKREKKVMQTINLESSGFSDCDYLIQKDICFDSETNIFKSVHSNFCFKNKQYTFSWKCI